MKRRLTIARSLINRPDLLLLDEPTTGLDPQARHVLWDQLFRLKQTGVTLVITTHYMDEAEQLCDRLVVMDKGLIVAEGSPLELIREHSTREVAELRFGVADEDDDARRAGREGRRPRRPGRGAARPAAASTATTATSVLAKVHERGLRAGRHAGAPQHARGRLPAPHRPDAGRLMADAPRPTSSTVQHRGLPIGEGIGRLGRLLADRLQAHLAGLGRSARSSRRCSTSSRWACCSAASSTATPTSSRARRPTSPSSCPG